MTMLTLGQAARLTGLGKTTLAFAAIARRADWLARFLSTPSLARVGGASSFLLVPFRTR